MSNNLNENHPIDVVFLWVNGNDANHKEKMLPFLSENQISNTKSYRTQYNQVDEIKYSVDSVLKFAPYIRKIHIVTDNQTPHFLKEVDSKNKYQKVTIVDHKTIFNGYREYLPTFNCRAIESCIHKIPDLAEHFIYLNDDFFLINPTSPDFFFRNGLPVLRGKWTRLDKDKLFRKEKKNKAGHKKAQQKGAEHIGFTERYYRFRHTPHPIRKSTLENFFNQNNELFLNNIKYKFRNKNQFALQGLANHIEIKNGSCILTNSLSLTYFRSYKKPLVWYKIKLNVMAKNSLFLGLQNLDLCPPNKLKYILNWLKLKTN